MAMINGTSGDDILTQNAGEDDIVDGLDGFDTLDLGAVGSGVTVNLYNSAGQTIAPGQGFDSFSNIEAVIGTAFNDVLIASNAGSTFTGGLGNDVLLGRIGADVLHGEDGNDVLVGRDGADVLQGGDGDDILRPGLSETAGSADTDTINGGAGVDLLDLSRDASASAIANGVVVNLDAGVVLSMNKIGTYANFSEIEIFRGSVGGDGFLGDVNANTLYGEAGDDTIEGGNGDDLLYGGAGADNISGDADNDTIYGEAGDDTLDGGDGTDTVYGGDGADRITGGSGDDTLHGGSGDDTFTDLDGTNEFNGADGTDTFDLTGFAQDTVVSLRSRIAFDSQALVFQNKLTLIENVIGGDGKDTILGGMDDNKLEGMGGNDVLQGLEGSDMLLGGDGDDFIRTVNRSASGEVNHADGGEGSDILDYRTFNSGTTLGVSIDVAAGTATDLGNQGKFSDTFVNIEKFFTGERLDLLTAAGATQDVFFKAGGGDDTLIGGDGNDVLVTDNGNDIASGGAGNDTLQGKQGNDELSGEAGDDVLLGGIGDDMLNGGVGNDALFGGDGDDTMIGGAGEDYFMPGTGTDTVDGGAELDTVDLRDSLDGITVDLRLAGPQMVSVSLGAKTLTDVEVILAPDFASTLDGNGESNGLVGGAGDDVLNGWGGDDLLDGKGGADTLTASDDDGSRNVFLGGAGADQFNITESNQRVEIEDFESGVDHITITFVGMDPTYEQFLASYSAATPDTITYGDLTLVLKGLDVVADTVAADFGLNMTPVAMDQATNVSEDAAGGPVAFAGSDPDGNLPLVFTIDATGTVGAVTNNNDGTFTYDPNGQFESLGAMDAATDTFAYTLTDGLGATDTATVTVTINGANDAPTINATSAVSISENTTDVELNASANDVDAGDTVTFEIVGGDDAALFNIDGSTGDLSFINAPDFEAPTDNDNNNVYLVDVAARDTGGLLSSNTINVAVTVTDVLEAPPPPMGNYTMDFEGFDTGGSPIDSQINGFSFSEIGTLSVGNGDAPFTGYFNAQVSPSTVGFKIGSGTGIISRGTDFDFEGGYFTGIWNNGMTVTLTGRDDGVDKGSVNFVVDTSGPTLVDVSSNGAFKSIDQLVMTSTGGTAAPHAFRYNEHLGFDDLVFTV